MKWQYLRNEERGLEIDVHHVVPVLLAEVHRIGAADQAGVVDQDVQPAQAFDGLADHARHRLDADQVGFDGRQRTSAVIFSMVSVGGAMPATANVGASGYQCHGDALAQTGIATGYQSDLAFQAEGISHCVCVP